ncbi:uncharacterized protein LOC110683384 [Chenopodium quinoa]|uniref:Uncharacterized protein n=1 Tax=Chenopodium quinoa TaxID=63459 RepID=A0A803LX61_CHEQI|nr:uncharacterized protein LOC110683384 [Chenopodium quinoa]
MDNKKPQISSSSSLTSQLFGPQESSSSNDVLASIFPPKGTGRNSGYSENRGSWQEPSGNQPWNTKQDNTYKHGDTAYGCSANKERSTIYQQEGGEPCYLSSSLYYGGRDMYSKPPTNQNPTTYPTYKKDGGEDDPSGASRGNWWQGSLYY